MNISQSVIDDLAVTWIRLHRSAARHHLEHMIERMRRSGDSDGVTNYGRVLNAVLATEQNGSCGASSHSMSDVDGSLSALTSRRRDEPVKTPFFHAAQP